MRFGDLAAEDQTDTGAALLRREERHEQVAGVRIALVGAIGHAVGMGNSPVIQVLVEEITPGARAQLPAELEGIPVVLEEVGQVRGMPSCRKK